MNTLLHYIEMYEARANDLRGRLAEGEKRGASDQIQDYRRRWIEIYTMKAAGLRSKLNNQ